MRRAPAVLLLAVFGLLAGCSRDVTDNDIKAISLTELRSLTEGKNAGSVMLVDPRAKSDFDAGHLPGAQNYGINDERARNGPGLNPVFKGHKAIVVYGNDPDSAPGKAMTKRLMMAKAEHVKFFAGGLIEWRRAGLPVEKTPGVADTTKKSETLAK